MKYTSESKTVQLADGRQLGYAEYGDSTGKPLLYFHGWPGSRLSGIETDEAAKKLRVRVLSIDRPGFGLSDYKEGRTLLDWADDVTELVDTLKIKKFSIVGVSGGGPYVAVCAYKIPHRIQKAGIVVGLAPPYIQGILEGMSFQGKLGWASYKRFPFVRTISALGAVLQFSYFPTLGLVLGFEAKEDRVLLRTTLKDKINGAITEAFRQGIKGPRHDLKVYTDNWGFDLTKIKVPVFLWYGAKDKNVSLSMGKYYESTIPKSTLFINQNGGHLFRNEHEEEIIGTLIKEKSV